MDGQKVVGALLMMGAGCMLAAGACVGRDQSGAPAASKPPQVSSADNSSGPVVGTFEGIIDPANGRFEITRMTTVQGISPANVVQDGNPGVGPPNSVELVTSAVGAGAAQCGGFANSFCGTVTIRSFYTAAITSVFAHITSITPAANHAPLNSDPAQMGLNNTFGLWGYGTLATGGNNTRQWVFNNDGTSWQFTGEVQANLPGAFYSHTFPAGMTHDDFVGFSAFQAALSAGIVYNTVTFGAAGVATFTCTGAQANAICQAIRTSPPAPAGPCGSTPIGPQTFVCGADTWHVGTCVGPWIDVNAPAFCTCTTNTFLPEIAHACSPNANWGGINQMNCPAPMTQTIQISCQ